MPEYNRIDIFDVNKTTTSKECHICHYRYFKDVGFKYEPNLCNCCHDLMQKAMSFNDVDIVYVKENACRIHFWYMSKDYPVSVMSNSNFVDKMVFCNFFIIYKKGVTWLIVV